MTKHTHTDGTSACEWTTTGGRQHQKSAAPDTVGFCSPLLSTSSQINPCTNRIGRQALAEAWPNHHNETRAPCLLPTPVLNPGAESSINGPTRTPYNPLKTCVVCCAHQPQLSTRSSQEVICGCLTLCDSKKCLPYRPSDNP